MKKKIFIIGAGGHAKTCIDVIESNNKFKVAYLVDKKSNKKIIFNHKIIKESNFMKKEGNKKLNILIGIGQIKNNNLRKNIFFRYKKFGCNFPNITSKFSYVSKNSLLKEGILICHGVVINAGVEIGLNCIINNQALIEHDARVGNHCHISTGSIINGGTIIGSNTFIGSGTTIKENIMIGNNCVIGAGLTIKKNIKSNTFLK
jgi:sugar O-acyltransferase (sialic acid O-acetyltransferase NeuD family)